MAKKKFLPILIIVLVVAILIGIFALLRNRAADTPGDAESQADTAASELLSQGYTQSLCTYQDNLMCVEFVSENHTDFVLLKCKMSDAQADEFFAIDGMAEDYAAQCLAYLTKVGNLTAESLNDKIPPQSTFDAYAGKTIADLEADGFEQTSLGDGDDGNLYFEYSNENYTLRVLTVEKYQVLFDMQDVDLSSLEIESVSFYDFCHFDF